MSPPDTIDEVFAGRQCYWANGYRPVAVWSPDQRVNHKGEPLKSPGKQPCGRWRKERYLPPSAVEDYEIRLTTVREELRPAVARRLGGGR